MEILSGVALIAMLLFLPPLAYVVYAVLIGALDERKAAIDTKVAEKNEGEDCENRSTFDGA